jgi:hypothetical protein
MSNWRVIPKSGNDFRLAKAKGNPQIFLRKSAMYILRFLIILSANIFLEKLKKKNFAAIRGRGVALWRAKKCRKACCLPQWMVQQRQKHQKVNCQMSFG